MADRSNGTLGERLTTFLCQLDGAESIDDTLTEEKLSRGKRADFLLDKVLIERWRQHYNTIRPHSSLGYWTRRLS